MFYSTKLKKFKEIKHCFFSKRGGYSSGVYKSLNCGRGSRDKTKNVEKNLLLVAEKMKVKRTNLILMHQTHSNKVIEIKKDFSRYLSDDAIIWDWHWPIGHYEYFFDGDSTTPNWEYSGMTGEKHKPTYDSVNEFLEALYQDRYLQKTINSATGKIAAARQNWDDEGSNLFLLGVQKIRLYDSDDTKFNDYSSIIDQHTFIKENGIEATLEKHRIQIVKFWKDYTDTILNFYS